MALRQIVRRLMSSRLQGPHRYNSSTGREWLRIVTHTAALYGCLEWCCVWVGTTQSLSFLQQLCMAVSCDAVCGDNTIFVIPTAALYGCLVWCCVWVGTTQSLSFLQQLCMAVSCDAVCGDNTIFVIPTAALYGCVVWCCVWGQHNLCHSYGSSVWLCRVMLCVGTTQSLSFLQQLCIAVSCDAVCGDNTIFVIPTAALYGCVVWCCVWGQHNLCHSYSSSVWLSRVMLCVGTTQSLSFLQQLCMAVSCDAVCGDNTIFVIPTAALYCCVVWCCVWGQHNLCHSYSSSVWLCRVMQCVGTTQSLSFLQQLCMAVSCDAVCGDNTIFVIPTAALYGCLEWCCVWGQHNLCHSYSSSVWLSRVMLCVGTTQSLSFLQQLCMAVSCDAVCGWGQRNLCHSYSSSVRLCHVMLCVGTTQSLSFLQQLCMAVSCDAVCGWGQHNFVIPTAALYGCVMWCCVWGQHNLCHSYSSSVWLCHVMLCVGGDNTIFVIPTAALYGCVMWCCVWGQHNLCHVIQQLCMAVSCDAVCGDNTIFVIPTAALYGCVVWCCVWVDNAVSVGYAIVMSFMR